MKYLPNSSTTDEDFKEITSKIHRYAGIIIFFAGIIGNILNILLLSHRSLRSNTCVTIFIGSSITGTITILSGLISRVTTIWIVDLTDTIHWICKCRGFILYTFRFMTFWLIMLATIDRWLVSSRDARLRRLSSIKNVFRSIFLIGIFSILIHLQIFSCHKANLKNTPLECFNKDMKCRLLNDLIFAFVTILIPLMVIVVFGWMTILNVRSTQSVMKAKSINKSSKRRDQDVFRMLLIQVILLACLTLPMAIQKLYTTFKIHHGNDHRSKHDKRMNDFIYRIALLMTFIANGMQFYVNALSGGRVFRKVLVDFFRSIKCR